MSRVGDSGTWQAYEQVCPGHYMVEQSGCMNNTVTVLGHRRHAKMHAHTAMWWHWGIAGVNIHVYTVMPWPWHTDMQTGVHAPPGRSTGPRQAYEQASVCHQVVALERT